MAHYVALLRGINVGGNNLIKMPALKACLEAQGLRDVVTYIQSGNVVFQSGEPRLKLTRQVEQALGTAFNYQATVVLRSRKQLQDTIAGAPKGFGANTTKYRYDVIFLKEPLSAAVAMKSVRTKEGVDEAHAGVGALYFSRLIRRASQSLLSRIISLPIYKSMTIRNWNTTTALLRMMQGGAGAD
jgi:uncharacterized protein (DUF1697 family)